jgi:cell division septation protein DedD
MWDVVKVNLPYTVSVGDKTLQPGEYTIQQLRSPGGASRVLLIYSDQGMKFETSAMTIPALDINTARDTKVVLHHFGPEYYFDKIWIQGKDYGYEFPLPDSVKARQRERMEPVSVAATYSTMPAQETTSQESTVAQSTTPARPPVTTQPETTPQPTTPPPSTVPATPVPEPSASREMPQETAPSMPATSAGWVMLLLAGGALSGAGLALRRR